jgi:hypothetical protein
MKYVVVEVLTAVVFLSSGTYAVVEFVKVPEDGNLLYEM